MHQQFDQKPCRFYTHPNSGRVPIIFVDTSDTENPCRKLAHNWDIDERLVIGAVGQAVCALQRECEVCPRELGPEVAREFIPFNQRK